jgi:AbrB family looped-hinge helix DNA binding protein
MATKTKEREAQAATCCGPDMTSCCRVEAIVTVDERGQMVLPKDVREKAGIKAGDKLTLVSMDREGKTCCIVMMKTDELAGMVRGMLGPLTKEIFG